MLVGSSTSHIIQVVTSAAADIEVNGSVIATDTSTPPVVQGGGLLPVVLASITSATTTAFVTGAASTIKRLMEATLRNNHASVTCDVTVQYTDGTNTNTKMKCTLLPGEVLCYFEGNWAHFDSNGALYAVNAAAVQNTPLMMNANFSTAALTSTKTITTATAFAVYVGRLTKAVSSVAVRARVTTAMATITWGEVAIAKGNINIGGNPTLTVVGFADVSATYNSTGQKSTTVNVSSGQTLNAGDDLWIIIGNQATTAAVMRAPSIADDIQVGQQASLGSRPSTIVGTPTAWTIESATTLPAWVAAVVT